MVAMGSGLDSSGKITLDRDAFKVLASETRIGILKELDKTQLTVSDLARALDMSKATLFEHLEKLIKAGLIRKKEDERKWVYYKLTWKGKNILHPERTKIAIALIVFIVAFSVIAIFFLISQGSEILPSNQDEIDSNVPTIEFEEVPDITDKAISTQNIIIKLSDNKDDHDTGIDESSLKIEYTISAKFTHRYQTLTGWGRINGVITDNKVTVQIPITQWSDNTGKYLYIYCSVKDNADNWAWKIYIEHIERTNDTHPDVSIAKSDVILDQELRFLPQEGIQNIVVRLKIHNTGSSNIRNLTVSIFQTNPDTDLDGHVDNIKHHIKDLNIDRLNSGDYKEIETNLNLNLSMTKNFWVAIDPNNEINESNEQNNIAMISQEPISGEKAIPEFPPILVIIVVIFIIIINLILKKHNTNKNH